MKLSMLSKIYPRNHPVNFTEVIKKVFICIQGKIKGSFLRKVKKSPINVVKNRCNIFIGGIH